MKGLHDLKNKILKVGAVNCFISEITLAELKFGVENSQAKEKNATTLADFLTGVTVIPVFTSLDMIFTPKKKQD
jgi:tRNA(fMet)-specific endonuclease VapC